MKSCGASATRSRLGRTRGFAEGVTATQVPAVQPAAEPPHPDEAVEPVVSVPRHELLRAIYRCGLELREQERAAFALVNARGEYVNVMVRNGVGGLVEVLAPNEFCLELRGVVGFRVVDASLTEEDQDAETSRAWTEAR
jgi:hypothetical protein